MTNRYDPPPRSAHHFTSRLDDEWQELRRQRRSLRGARAWATSAPGDSLASVLSDLTDLNDLLEAAQGNRGRGVNDGPDNAVLLRLVEIARHDQLAGRIVIQRLLPGLIRRAATYRSYYDDIDPAEIIVPAAWLALRNYDVDRRRRHVAASLLSDATFFAFRKQLRRLSANEVVRPPQAFLRTAAPATSSTALEELATVVRDAQAAGVSTYDIDLIRHLVRAASPGTVASERDVTTRTVRNHRARAINNVRKALAIAA
jgi:hypothetical protein